MSHMSLIAKLREAVRHRPKLSLTQRGGAFCALTLGVGVVALNSGNNLIYLVLSMMLALILSSGILSSINLNRVRVKRRPSVVGQVGVPMGIKLSLVNQKLKWPSMGIAIDDPPVKRLSEGEVIGFSEEVNQSSTRSLYVFRIRGGEEEKLHYSLSFPKRGSYLLSGTRIYTRFPFGFFEKSIGLRLQLSLTITPFARAKLPKKLEERLTWLGTVSHEGREQKSDSHPFSLTQRGVQDWVSLSPYLPGESLRSIHWKASARRGELISRRGLDQGATPLIIYLNPHTEAEQVDPAEEDRLMDMLVSVCTRWWDQNYPVTLYTPSQTRKLLPNSPQVEEFLVELATMRITPHSDQLIPPPQALALSVLGGVSLLGEHPYVFVPEDDA